MGKPVSQKSLKEEEKNKGLHSFPISDEQKAWKALKRTVTKAQTVMKAAKSRRLTLSMQLPSLKEREDNMISLNRLLALPAYMSSNQMFWAFGLL